MDNTGMLPDGTNPEGVDPVPALGWRSVDDLKNVVVYGATYSPGTVKVVAYLTHFGIPFQFKKTGPKPSSKYYTRFPVIDVGGRQVNDSYVIVKHLLLGLTGGFDEMWEQRITRQFFLTTERDLFLHSTDSPRLVSFILREHLGAFGSVPAWLFSGMIAKAGASMYNKKLKEPGAKDIDTASFLREFGHVVGTKMFFHGDQPGQVDISLFATCVPWKQLPSDRLTELLENAGLQTWWSHMSEQFPLDVLHSSAAARL